MSTFFRSALAIPAAREAAPSPALCPGDLPLVLFPVRLETRFFTPGNGTTELRVRVFPDKIHVDSHEPDLTADERTWGEHYWRHDWMAGSDLAARSDVWRQLADRFGARRAAWIVRVLLPTNAAQRPDSPTPAGSPPVVNPVFPDVVMAEQNDAWRHAPQARLLPDRWVAIVHAGGSVAATVTGGDVRRPLPVGPNPLAPRFDSETDAAIARGERLAIDADMLWMIDYDEAERAGMALRIPLSAAIQAAGIDSLVVFGVAASLTVEATTAQLADLLDAHHYTDGLGFVRAGTPTNNTEDRRAGYSSDDPGHERSFILEVRNTPDLDDNNALHVGTAIGLRAERILPALGRVERGLDRDGRAMRSMNAALWQVGWGYFLSNMIGAEAGLTPADLDWARDHFLAHVRGFGPLPALRCGAQPYGLLPVTSLDLWQPAAGEPATAQDLWLKGMLQSLREIVWRPAGASVARIGNRQNPPDPDADLNDVMRTDAVSNAYRTRNVFGQHFLQHLSRFVGSAAAGSDPAQTALLEQLGVTWRPRLARLWNAGWRRTVAAPLVQAGEVSPWAELEPNYITALRSDTDVDHLILARPDAAGDGTSLLQMLLRHALLREIAHAAARLQAGESGASLQALLRDAELVDLVNGAQPTLHWQRQLDLRLAVTGGRTIREFLASPPSSAPALAALAEFRASLAHLESLDSEALSHLMQGTLDLSTHRLDAWVTSIATKRLAAIRRAAPSGQYVGAYGWVENLTPIPSSMVRPVSALPAGEPGPLQTAANDSGFIHAPSLAHAATAAVLRNAQLGPAGVPQPDGPFAIELSSRRVREASRLLEGVRQGQPLGALLGYRVERLLHATAVDNGRTMDRFIAPLRRVAPLAARSSAPGNAPIETIAANNVVDGLVLNRRWKEERAAVLAELNTAGMGTGDLAALTSIMDTLADSIDGLSDALTAESAYQMVRGNTARVASTLAAIAQGDAPPPELEVTRIPRSGTSITHRLLLLMSGPNVNTPGWLGVDNAARGAAEKMLNFWAFTLFGDGTRIRCTVERLDAGTGAVVQTHAFPLSELGITPLDVVYGVEAANTAAEQPAIALDEIEQHVLYHAKHRAGGFEAAATLRLQHAMPGNLAAGEVTLFDVLEQARNIRRLLQVARGADPEDVNPPERTGMGTIDLADLEARVVRAENGLNAAHKALVNLIARIGTTTTAEMLRTALLKLGSFTIAPAGPISALGESAEAIATLARQGQALLKISGPRLDHGAALRTQLAALDPRGRREQLVTRMRAVFGPAFVVLPKFTIDSAASTEFGQALAVDTGASAADPLPVHTWFSRCARVREGATQLGTCLQRADVLGTGARLDLRVAQLPFVAGERWVGVAPAPGTPIPPSKLSLVLHTIGPLNPGLALTGLLVDEWVEIVPSARETTALAFQFDAPGGCAPQSVLIAVPPVPGQDWTAETLRRVLMETLDLAKLRAVDPDSLGAAAQHLPGLYLAFNTEDHAVSTDFAPLTN